MVNVNYEKFLFTIDHSPLTNELVKNRLDSNPKKPDNKSKPDCGAEKLMLVKNQLPYNETSKGLSIDPKDEMLNY